MGGREQRPLVKDKITDTPQAFHPNYSTFYPFITRTVLTRESLFVPFSIFAPVVSHLFLPYKFSSLALFLLFHSFTSTPLFWFFYFSFFQSPSSSLWLHWLYCLPFYHFSFLSFFVESNPSSVILLSKVQPFLSHTFTCTCALGWFSTNPGPSVIFHLNALLLTHSAGLLFTIVCQPLFSLTYTIEYIVLQLPPVFQIPWPSFLHLLLPLNYRCFRHPVENKGFPTVLPFFLCDHSIKWGWCLSPMSRTRFFVALQWQTLSIFIVHILETFSRHGFGTLTSLYCHGSYYLICQMHRSFLFFFLLFLFLSLFAFSPSFFNFLVLFWIK